MAGPSNYILALIIAMFVLQLFTGIGNGIITSLFLFAPGLALTEPWRFLTSIFLHGSIMHLFFNAYALFMFGNMLEGWISRKDYLVLFFGAGITGSLFYYATYVIGLIPPVPALGASGAIYGILGAVAVLLPDTRIYMWFFPMRMREAAMFWIVLELLGTFDLSSGIASAAHLGGLLFGLVYAWDIKRRTWLPPVTATDTQ